MPAPRSQTADVRTKSVYEPAGPADGHRVLVTQYWPRGVARAAVDEYVRALAPSRELLQAYKAERLEWDAFRHEYVQQMRSPEAQKEIRRLAEEFPRQPVTLLCVCRDPERCHVAPLQALIADAAARTR